MFVVFTEPVFSVLLFSFFSLVFSGKKNSAVAFAGGLITLWTFNIYFTILNVKKTKKQWKQQPNKALTFLWMHAAQTYSLLLTHFIWRTRLPRHRKNPYKYIVTIGSWKPLYLLITFLYSLTHKHTCFVCFAWLSVSPNNRMKTLSIYLFILLPMPCSSLTSHWVVEATFPFSSNK